MKNNLIKCFALFLIIAQGLMAEEETESVIEEDKDTEEEIYIEELVEEYDEIPGFFLTYRDPETNQIFLKISDDQLKKEFIYFAHSLNGVATSGKVRGSYIDEGVFKIEKDYENLRFSRVLTNYVFDEGLSLIHI